MASLIASLNIARIITITCVEPIVFVLGVLGSLLNTVLFSATNLRSTSCCIYFLASSFAALILLSMGIVPLIYAEINSYNPYLYINSFCKIRFYVNQCSAMSCRWLLVMACIDRCLACSNNAHVLQFLTVRMARRIALIIVFVWMILPLHLLIFANIVPPGNILCRVSDNTVAIYHGIYTIIMGGTLPPIVMTTCALIIWKNLRDRNRLRENLNLARSERRRNFRNQQVIIILLAQVVIFIVSTIPFMSNTLYSALTRDVSNKSDERRAIETFAQVITELFVYIFPASSFYSNTLVSRTFRKRLLTLSRSFIRRIFRNETRVTPFQHVAFDNRRNNISLTPLRRFRI